MVINTSAVLLRNTDLAVPAFKAFAHNLTHEAANALAEEIHQQTVEGERVTRVYTIDGLEVHESSNPEDCHGCRELILAAHKLEFAEIEKEMRRRGLK
jgi:hypothetical protein